MGTAKITQEANLFIVRWTNIGNDLRPFPRAFRTEPEARQFCRERSLRVVS